MSDQSESTREAILRAAEDVFAHRGFAGASIRLIAAAAGVNSALVGYHFGAKSELYETLFANRYQEITAQRVAQLEAVKIVAGDRGGLEAVLSALMRPFVERLHTKESSNFVHMLANEALDPRSSTGLIVEKYLNPTAQRFMAAMKQALPTLSRKDLAWGYQYCVVTMLTSASSAGRSAVLSGGESLREDPEAMIHRMITYCAAGLMAVAAKETRARSARSKKTG